MGGRGSSGGGGGGSAKLPALSGSPKQIAWAEDIRREAFRTLDKLETALKKGDDWAILTHVSKEGKTILDAEVRVIGSNGKARINSIDIKAMRTDLKKYFMTDSGKKAENIIDKRGEFHPDNISGELQRMQSIRRRKLKYGG